VNEELELNDPQIEYHKNLKTPDSTDQRTLEVKRYVKVLKIKPSFQGEG
jgi:hypothetical protein